MRHPSYCYKLTVEKKGVSMYSCVSAPVCQSTIHKNLETSTMVVFKNFFCVHFGTHSSEWATGYQNELKEYSKTTTILLNRFAKRNQKSKSEGDRFSAICCRATHLPITKLSLPMPKLRPKSSKYWTTPKVEGKGICFRHNDGFVKNFAIGFCFWTGLVWCSKPTKSGWVNVQ